MAFCCLGVRERNFGGKFGDVFVYGRDYVIFCGSSHIQDIIIIIRQHDIFRIRSLGSLLSNSSERTHTVISKTAFRSYPESGSKTGSNAMQMSRVCNWQAHYEVIPVDPHEKVPNHSFV